MKGVLIGCPNSLPWPLGRQMTSCPRLVSGRAVRAAALIGVRVSFSRRTGVGTRGTLPGTLLQKQGLLPSWVWSGGGPLGPQEEPRSCSGNFLPALSPSTHRWKAPAGGGWGGGRRLLPFPLVPEPLPHVSAAIPLLCFLHPCFPDCLPAPPGVLRRELITLL